MNRLEETIIMAPFNKEEKCGKFIIDDTSSAFVFHGVVDEIGTKHVFSFWVRSDNNGSVLVAGEEVQTSTSWTRCVIPFIASSKDISFIFNANGTYYFFETQLEQGSIPTGYRLAVEDEVETRSIATQTRDMFKWIVKSDESSSEFTLTDRMATLIADTISLNGDVKVRGDMIVNGTITADKIDIKNLFAQNIEAEGTIKGLKLEGASGDFSGQVKADSLYVNGNIIYADGGDYEINHVDYDSSTGAVVDVFTGFYAAYDSSVIGNRDNPQGILRIDSVLAVEITGNLFGIQTLSCDELLSSYVKTSNVYAKIIRANKIYIGTTELNQVLNRISAIEKQLGIS